MSRANGFGMSAGAPPQLAKSTSIFAQATSGALVGLSGVGGGAMAPGLLPLNAYQPPAIGPVISSAISFKAKGTATPLPVALSCVCSCG
jgi:hypothetical protein